MKQTALIVFGWLALMLGITVHAASFDCAKAGTKVEKLICGDAELSKLDEELNAAYKAAVQDKTKADVVKQAQKQWMKERSGCADAACVKGAYEARFSTLTSTDNDRVQQDTSAMSEKAKGEMVSKILNGREVTLRSVLYTPEDVKFCNGLLDDFKQQRGIEYIEPKFRTNDYNHPELAKLRNQCPNIDWTERAPKKCDAESLAYWLKGYEGNKEAARQKADEMCAMQFGTDEFALYEIDFGDHKEHVIYQSRSPKIYLDELDRLLRKPSKKELWVDHSAWNRRTNTVMNVFFSDAGYSAFDFSKCAKSRIVKFGGVGGTTSPEAHQGFIKYAGKYMAYNLTHYGRESREDMIRDGRQAIEYIFTASSGYPLCYLDAVQSKSTKTRSTK